MNDVAINLEKPPVVKMVADRQVRKDGSLEPDILAGHERSRLIFKTLDGEELCVVMTSEDWDQESLQRTAEGVALMLPEKMYQGADAYLEDQFIGSTEI